MKRDTQKNIRTATGVAAWAVMTAVSQDSAARDTLQREHFARHSDWQAHLMAEAPCGESRIPTLGGSDRALLCSDAVHFIQRSQRDRWQTAGDRYLFLARRYVHRTERHDRRGFPVGGGFDHA